MKLLWHSYLVPSLGTRAMKLCTETGLIMARSRDAMIASSS
jgi:hypothetical protein